MTVAAVIQLVSRGRRGLVIVQVGYGSNDSRLSLRDEELVTVSTAIAVKGSGKQAEIKSVSPHNAISLTGRLTKPETTE